jgi:hypothetical protein
VIVCGQIEFSKHVNSCSLSGKRTHLPGQHPLMADKNACAFQYLRLDLWVFSDDAEEAVFFVGDSSREEDSVGEW